MFIPPSNYTILISLCTGDKSAHVSGKSRNPRQCSSGRQMPFAFFSCIFCSSWFVHSNKKNSQTTSHKVHSLWSLKPLSYKQLPRNPRPASWDTLDSKAGCTQQIMLMSILNYTCEQDSAFAPCRASKLADLCWIFWQKRLYLFTFGIPVSKGNRPCPDQEACGESEAAIWFSLVAWR